MGKGAGSVSIIGGADEPASIFIAGKGSKVKLTTRIRNYFRKIKRNRIKKRIIANPHMPEEVVQWLKREYGAVDVSQQSHNYSEQDGRGNCGRRKKRICSRPKPAASPLRPHPLPGSCRGRVFRPFHRPVALQS